MARDEQTKLETNWHSQYTQAKQAQEKLEAVKKETEQKNELLLLQLHQVQEELEQYFLKYQELARESGNVQEAKEEKKIEIGDQCWRDMNKPRLPTLTRTDSSLEIRNMALQFQVEELAEARDEQANLAAEHKALLDKANQAKAEQEKLAKDRQAQVEELAEARDEQANLAAEHKALLDKPNQAKAEQEKLAKDRQAQVEELAEARDEQANLAAEHKALLDKANQAKAEQEKLAKDRQAQVEELAEARDEQANLAAEHKALLDKPNQAKAEQEKLAKDRQAQVEELAEARDEQERLAVTHQQQCNQERQRADDNQRQLEQNRENLEKLEQQLIGLNHRLPMLDNEFAKAEAQIELIKDILIRDKAF